MMKMTPRLYGRFVTSFEQYGARAGVGTTRERWDSLWNIHDNHDATLLQDAYTEGLNDSHIDTALRRICRKTGE